MSCIYSIDGISRKERERGKKREKRDNVKDKEISWRVRREEGEKVTSRSTEKTSASKI